MPSTTIPPEYTKHLERQGFILDAVLGQGLSGSVYSATQPTLNRKVAVKFFDSAFVRNDEAMLKRFIREAKLLARFQHPGLPYVLTEGAVQAEHGTAPYFVMEHIEGKTLSELLQTEQRLQQPMAIDYITQLLDALGYAHAHKIVHRDVKPSNVMIDQRGRCFLIDFSIGVSLAPSAGLSRATMIGEILGSSTYMAPEQRLDSSTVDGRADIYSMGAVLLEMLTGQTDRTNIARTLLGFPRSVIVSIETACASLPNARFRTAEDFIRALGGGRQLRTPPLSPALAICTNLKCSGANWSGRGYYRGPNVMEDASDSFCTSCGEQLTYQCSSCGVPIANTPFCGGCGADTFRVPECKLCGSWLTKEYMDTKGANGCRKCLNSRQVPKPSFLLDSDDIPF